MEMGIRTRKGRIDEQGRRKWVMRSESVLRLVGEGCVGVKVEMWKGDFMGTYRAAGVVERDGFISEKKRVYMGRADSE